MKKMSQKIILVSVVFSSLLFLSLFLTIFSTNAMKDLSTDIFSEQGFAIVEKAQGYIDGNQFERFTKNMKRPNDFFYETQEVLFELKNHNECAYLYTMIPGKGTDFYYVLDASDDPSLDESENEEPGSIFDATDDYEVLQEVLAEKEIRQTEMYFTEEWGWIVTFYGPILNSSDEVVGIVAADYLVADFLQDIKNIRLKMFLVSAVLLILAVVVTIFYLSSFFKKLFVVNKAMKEIATGETDLTARIPVNKQDEIGQLATSCNEVISKLQTIMASIKESIGGLSDKSTQLHSNSEETVIQINAIKENVEGIDNQADSQHELTNSTLRNIEGLHSDIQSLASTLDEQNQAINQSSTAIEEITANIESISRNVNNMAEEYKSIVQEAKDGTQLQDLVKLKVEEIESQAENLNDANVIITSIAEQTNLLAMNAAIEAAHAGSAGAGFSVVAEEIRILAETSNRQTASIKELLFKINRSIEEISSSSIDSARTFTSLGNRIISTEKMLQQIQNGINEQNDASRHILQMVEVINTSAHEIMEDSTKMKENGDIVHKNVTSLSQASDEILNKTHTMVLHLDEIKESAEGASESATINLGLTEKLNSLVLGYKTE